MRILSLAVVCVLFAACSKPEAAKEPPKDRVNEESIGKAKALTATARKIAILFYRAMRFGMRYQDPGADQYERRYRERVVKQLHRRAAHFGFSLQPVEPSVS